MRVNLKVPFDERGEAKRLGASWDAARKTWYVQNRENLKPFLKWMPERLRRPVEVTKREQIDSDTLNHLKSILDHG
jgi:hypothetical protein